MKILSIDTASNLCTVALLEDEFCIKEIIVDDARNHSEKIMPVIEQVLKDTNLTLKDVDLIVCDKGPGSFTGIRIGVGSVLAFQDCLNIPCIGISSLESLAYNVKQEQDCLNIPCIGISSLESLAYNVKQEQDSLICSLIDAKNNNVYFGLFEFKNNEYIQIGKFEFKTISETISLLENYSNPITFIGDGTIVNKEILSENFTDCTFCNKNNLSSYSLGLAGLYNYKKGIETSVMPLYLRKSQAERALEEKQQKGVI